MKTALPCRCRVGRFAFLGAYPLWTCIRQAISDYHALVATSVSQNCCSAYDGMERMVLMHRFSAKAECLSDRVTIGESLGGLETDQSGS